MIFDTHAHYDDEDFDGDREELLESLAENGIGRVVNIGASLESCRGTLALVDKYPFLYGTIGLHPNDVGDMTEDTYAWLKEQCAHPKCVAVGEIGLDYYWDSADRQVQKKWFRRQLQLAGEVQLPVVIHSREAVQDTVQILQEERAGELGGVIHCYSYTKESIKAFLDMGFYIGVGGVLTVKNGKKLREALEYVPMERIVLETDAPYLSPEPNRGRRNSSLNLPYVVKELARLKGISEEDVERITWENGCRLYRMSE